MTTKDEIPADDFDKAFAAVAAAAERSPEQVAADEKAAEAAAAAAESPEAKAAKEAADKAAAEAAAKADADAAAAAARAQETPEAKLARETAEAAAAKVEAEAKVAAEAQAKVAAEAAAKAEADAKVAREAEEKKQREANEAALKPYVPTAEEVAADAQFQKEFPTEYAAMQARFKAEKQGFNKQVHDAVQASLAVMAPRLAAVEATVATTSVDQHFRELRSAHPDYDAVIAKVPEWIKTLPAYAQTGAQAVYDGGTTGEVLALVADYKKATGAAAPDPAIAAAAAVKAKEEAARLQAQRDADAGLPVATRRTTAGGKPKADPNDYAGAFAEAAEAYAAQK